MIPLSRYHTLFPKHFMKTSSLKPNTLKYTSHTWYIHSVSKSFLGYFTIDVQHKTEQKIILITFYIFENTTRPQDLLYNPPSTHLGIIEFKVPEEVPNTTGTDAITNICQPKQITFSSPL